MGFRTVLILTFCVALSAVHSLAEKQYELRGKVVQTNGKRFKEVLPVVFLQGATEPFTTHTRADTGGKFSFKKLRPGLYTLIIAVPMWGDLQRTIEIGPSGSNSKGRIEKTFRVDREYSRPNLHIVSVQQLSVSRNARQELTRALERLEKRDVDGAIKHLEKAVELSPQFTAAWNQLGTIAYLSKEPKKAEEYFREALRQEADSYAPLVNLGGALLAQDRVEEAHVINLRAVQMRPEDALAHSQLGRSYFSLGELDGAQMHLKVAKTLDPKHFSFPQLVLAQIYELQSDFVSLMWELEEFLKYHPDSARVPEMSQWLERTRNSTEGALLEAARR
jgi:Tfp pilus assembly protein PilF